MALARLLLAAALAATALATLHDLANLAGHGLAPWFGWMLP